MEKLETAITLIDSLKGDDEKEKIVKRLQAAYDLSDECLDALTLLSLFTDDLNKKEEMLVEGLKKVEGRFDATQEDIRVNQYMRCLNELYEVYMNGGKLPLALKVADKIYELKGNIYAIKDRLYGLNAYFDKDRDATDVSPEVFYLIDLLYSYERSDNSCIEHRSKLISLCPSLSDVAKGLKKDDEESLRAANLLRHFAYYINRMPMVIKFLESGKL